jgi:uncharacterized protein YjbI with pentapeptide repeats
MRARLNGANLWRSDLSDADLSDANLNGANLSDTNLSRADLGRTHLTNAYLSRADLDGANLSGADVGNTIFVDVNLSSVIGLDSCEHRGPSIVDRATHRMHSTTSNVGQWIGVEQQQVCCLSGFNRLE